MLVQILGPSPSPGTPLKARILDVSKDTGIVDVTLKPSLIEACAAAAIGSKGKQAQERGKAEKKSKKRKAEEALDAAHAAYSSLKVSVLKKPLQQVFAATNKIKKAAWLMHNCCATTMRCACHL